MNRVILVVFLLIGLAFKSGHSQSVATPLNNAWQKIRVSNRVPIPLPAVQESDVMFTKRVWRYINLKEKTNAPLYFPIEPTRGRRSLFNVLVDAIHTPRSTTPFGTNTLRVFVDEEFVQPYTDVTSFDTSSMMRHLVPTTSASTGQTVFDTVYVKSFHISGVKVVEDWFFDKKRSQMDFRILALGLEIDERDLHPSKRTNPKTPLTIFWVYYPEARHWLCNQEIFNPKNDAGRISFDDYFLKRRFSSYIYKVENVHDRLISQYTNGLDALLESEKIKQEIFQFEHDLWEY
ncbi:MAG: gliding motility protein GldN [Bacteroidales bacterium]|nr:gliding motility protein GldN [Bacteroidales bacterium]MDD3665973.1 gliding motility protein GldN [Bacteroidales bacterium]